MESSIEKMSLDICFEGQEKRLKYYKGTSSNDLLELILKMFHKISPLASPEDINRLKLGCMFHDDAGDPVCFAPDVIPTNTKLHLRIQCVSISFPSDAVCMLQPGGRVAVYHPDYDYDRGPVNHDHSGCLRCMPMLDPLPDPSDRQARPVITLQSNGGDDKKLVGCNSRPVDQHRVLTTRPARQHRPVERLVVQHRAPFKPKVKRPGLAKFCGCVTGCINKRCKCKNGGNFCRPRCTCRTWGCINQQPIARKSVRSANPSSYWTWDPEINSHPNIMYTLSEGNTCVSAPVSRESSRSFMMPVLCGTRCFTDGKHQWMCKFTNRSTSTSCLVGLISKSEKERIKYEDYEDDSSQYPLFHMFSDVIVADGNVQLRFNLDMNEKKCTVKEGFLFEEEISDLPDEVWPAVCIKFNGTQCACRVSFDV